MHNYYNLLKVSYLAKSEKVYYFIDGKRVNFATYAAFDRCFSDCFTTEIDGDIVRQRKVVKLTKGDQN